MDDSYEPSMQMGLHSFLFAYTDTLGGEFTTALSYTFTPDLSE